MSHEGEVHMNQLFTSSMVIVIGAVLSVLPMALAQSFPPVVSQKIQAAQKQVKTIGTEEYRKVVESPGDALIVDVREPHEYAAGHVPGAINIPRGLSNSKSGSMSAFRPTSRWAGPCISNAKAATVPRSRHSLLRSWGSRTPPPW